MYKFLFETLLFVVLVVVYHYLDIKLMDKVEEIVKPYGEEVLKEVNKCIGKAQCLVILFGVLFIIIINYDTWAEPSAIDVYRGQTTLEINYKNEIPQDTIVVWKK